MITVLAHAVAAEHQLLEQLHAGADARVVEDDRVVDCGALTDVATRADHGGPNDRCAIFDLGHAAHVDRAGDVDLVPVGGHIQTGVNPGTHLLAGDAHLTDVTHQHAADGLPVVGNLADIHPFEIHRDGIEGCTELGQFREQIRADVEGLSRRDVFKDLRLEDVDAGVDRVAEGFVDAGLFLEA